MKKIGLIGYSNNSGLGQVAVNFRRNLPLDSQFVIKHPVKDYPGEIYNIGIPHTLGTLEATEDQLNSYLDICSPEVVIVVETPFNFNFFKILHDKGIKVVLIPMIDSISIERFIPYEKYIDLVINFTKVGQEIYEKRWSRCGIQLSYPVDTDIFNPDKLGFPTHIFLHSEGWGGAGFRKSTDLVFNAFRQLSYLHKDVTMLVNGQPQEQEHSQLQKGIKGVNIRVVDFPEAILTYQGGRVCVFPSRREGLGLPVREAMACGLPVITTDAPPMNEWFPEDYPLLVKVQAQSDLPYGDIPMYTPNVYDLMKKMEYAYNNPEEMEQLGKNNCNIIQQKYSWDVLKKDYLSVL